MKRAGVVLSLALLAASFLGGGVLSDRRHAAKLAATNDSAAAMVIEIEQLEAEREMWRATADSMARFALSAAAAVRELLARPVQIDTLWRTPPSGGPPVPIPVVAEGAYRQLEQRCTALAGNCAAALAAKDSAMSRGLVAHARERARGDFLQERLNELARPPRRLGLGCAGGVGGFASGGELRSGLGVVCGVTYSLR